MLATSDVFTAGNLTVSGCVLLVTAVFGWPAWKLARRSERQAEQAQLAEAVAKYLGIPIPDKGEPIPPPSKDNPNVLDLLTEIRDTAQEQAALALVVAYHMSDDHGQPIPTSALREHLTPATLRRRDGTG